MGERTDPPSVPVTQIAHFYFTGVIMKTLAYLYKWTELSTKKWYIGSKSSQGCSPAYHENYLCSSEIVKPLILENRDNWVCEILVIGDPKYIRKLETEYLKTLDAKNDAMSYNQSNACFDPGNRLGTKDSIATRKKKSLARQGDKNPMYGKLKEICPHYGKKHSDTRKKNISKSLSAYSKNRPNSHNQNISKALKGNPKLSEKIRGEKNPMYGKPRSDYNKMMTKMKNSGDGNPMKKPENQKLCLHCNKTVAKNHYTMYHGDKCKFNTENIIA